MAQDPASHRDPLRRRLRSRWCDAPRNLRRRSSHAVDRQRGGPGRVLRGRGRGLAACERGGHDLVLRRRRAVLLLLRRCHRAPAGHGAVGRRRAALRAHRRQVRAQRAAALGRPPDQPDQRQLRIADRALDHRERTSKASRAKVGSRAGSRSRACWPATGRPVATTSVHYLDFLDPLPIDVAHMRYDWVGAQLHAPRTEADSPHYAGILLRRSSPPTTGTMAAR